MPEQGLGIFLARTYQVPPLGLFQECEQLQKMYGGHVDERMLEKTQQQHILYQQEQHQQILQQQIQVVAHVGVQGYLRDPPCEPGAASVVVTPAPVMLGCC